MKRRLVVARVDNAGGDANSTEKRGCRIRPLGEEPSLQTLTPRSLARSVAELDALRSRVLALELQLSQNEVDTALLSAPQKSVAKKLPPIAGGGTGGGGADGAAGIDEVRCSDCLVLSASIKTHFAEGARDTKASLPLSTSLSTRITTAPEHSTRRAFALTLAASPTSPLASSSAVNPPLDTLSPGSTLSLEHLHPKSQHSQSACTLPSQRVLAEDSPAHSTEKLSQSSPAGPLATRSGSNVSGKRLSVSRSFTGLAPASPSPPREETKITLGQDGGDAVVAVSKRNRLYQILKQVSALVPIKEDEVSDSGGIDSEGCSAELVSCCVLCTRHSS